MRDVWWTEAEGVVSGECAGGKRISRCWRCEKTVVRGGT